jgi:hypothetical protein
MAAQAQAQAQSQSETYAASAGASVWAVNRGTPWTLRRRGSLSVWQFRGQEDR